MFDVAERAKEIIRKMNECHPGKGYVSGVLRELTCAALKEALNLVDWRSIDSAPKDGTWILLWYPKYDTPARMMRWACEGAGGWVSGAPARTVLVDWTAGEWISARTGLPLRPEDIPLPPKPTHWAPCNSP